MICKSPVIPAVLTTNSEEFKKRLLFAEQQARAVHIDVMDGEFCEGKSLPLNDWPIVAADYSEAHLMVKRPLDYLEQLAEKKITRAIIHVESDFGSTELRDRAKELDLLLGLAVNPDTDLDRLRSFYDLSSYIQVMGVHPGSSGQALISTTSLAVAYLKKNPMRRLLISVDGGVTTENLLTLKRAGANYIISTHAIFDQENWEEAYQRLVTAMESDDN